MKLSRKIGRIEDLKGNIILKMMGSYWGFIIIFKEQIMLEALINNIILKNLRSHISGFNKLDDDKLKILRNNVRGFLRVISYWQLHEKIIFKIFLGIFLKNMKWWFEFWESLGECL